MFYGLPRHVKNTYPFFLKNLIEPNEIEDIFIHTYKRNFGDEMGRRDLAYLENPVIYTPEDEEYLYKYNAKKILVEDENIVKCFPNYFGNMCNIS